MTGCTFVQAPCIFIFSGFFFFFLVFFADGCASYKNLVFQRVELGGDGLCENAPLKGVVRLRGQWGHNVPRSGLCVWVALCASLCTRSGECVLLLLLPFLSHTPPPPTP
jgi:hypothetical protein